MDPNQALIELRAALATSEDLDVVILFDGLDEWLCRGGFLPTAWAR